MVSEVFRFQSTADEHEKGFELIRGEPLPNSMKLKSLLKGSIKELGERQSCSLDPYKMSTFAVDERNQFMLHNTVIIWYSPLA